MGLIITVGIGEVNKRSVRKTPACAGVVKFYGVMTAGRHAGSKSCALSVVRRTTSEPETVM